MIKLTEAELNQALPTLPGWQLDAGELIRTLTFRDFRKTISFVNQLADLAETAGHHPDIDIRYNKLKLALTTHDSGGITSADVKMAGQINRLGDISL
jgi:4a-hydroxytetrahydrobiopterin dehydratase